MSRIITVVRHAKSSWNQAGIDDFNRPLNKRGLKNAAKMGKRLADAEFTVDKIISSPAARAMNTAEIIATEIHYNTRNIAQNTSIYEASLDTLVNTVTDLNDHLTSVMLVGHNPGFTNLCNYLGNTRIDNLPTCSIVQIKITTPSWSDITQHAGELIDFDYPKK